MWELIKHKFTKIGCFALIAIAMILTSGLTKLALGWLNYDPRTQEKISNSAGEYLGKGLLGLMFLTGATLIIIRLMKNPKVEQTIQSSNVSSPTTSHNSYAQNPPPLPTGNEASPQTRKSKKKGCCIAIAVLFTLFALFWGTICYLASEYEKRPKKPGQAAMEKAEDFIRTYNGAEASGNTPEGTELAADFARELRVARGILIQDGKAGFADTTHGRFLTYCFLTKKSSAIIVQVPNLRNFSEDAKLTLEESAWTIATHLVGSKHPQAQKMILGIKGQMDYSSIISGSVNTQDPLKGIEIHHPTSKEDAIWPYFISPAATEN